jgi:hypothetical protein
MDRKIFVTILGAYILGLIATGYMSFFRFMGASTMPPPEVISAIKNDPDAIKELWSDVDRVREQNAKLVDLAAHSFDVLLGALLGFLSAAGVSAGIGKPTEALLAATDKSPQAPPEHGLPDLEKGR